MSDDYTTTEKAFFDIKPFKPENAKIIYDPFYLDGKSKIYMEKVFSDCKIIHEEKDAFSWMPECDIIITNPPFSKKKEVLKWLETINKPFMVLLPAFTICNKYFQKLGVHKQVELVIPHGRYSFEFDSQSLKNAAFDCFWFCYKCNLPSQINYVTV